MKFFLTFISALTVSQASAAEPDLIFTLSAPTQSVTLRLHIELDGQPLTDALRPRFEKLFAHLDRDGNQQLNAEELSAAPSAGWLRRAAWGYLPANHSEPITLAEADSDQDGSISLLEFQTWYTKHGVGTITAVTARSEMTPILTTALWRRLDDNRDGHLSAAELAAIPERLRKLDEDDDDLVSAREIASSVEQPYPFATSRLSEPRFEIAPRTEPHQTLDLSVSARLSLKTKLAEVARLQPGTSNSDGVTFQLGDSHCSLLPARGDSNRWHDLAEPQAQAHFTAADKDHNQSVTAAEAAQAPNRSLLTLFDFADHDCDHRVTAAEWQSALDILAPLVEANVQLTVLTHEGSLFEWIDQNRDGHLSHAELQAAAMMIRPTTRKELPTAVTLFISLGQPNNSAATSTNQAPAWFTALDRNHDGVVTRSEFLGTHEDFQRFDEDQDERLTESEVRRAVTDKQPSHRSP